MEIKDTFKNGLIVGLAAMANVLVAVKLVCDKHKAVRRANDEALKAAVYNLDRGCKDIQIKRLNKEIDKLKSERKKGES